MTITAEVAEALFVSDLQPSDEVTVGQATATVVGSLQRHGGVRRCAAICAKEYGDHPDTAATRMRWALALTNELIDRSCGSPKSVLYPGAPNRTGPRDRPTALARRALAVSTAGVDVAERSGRRATMALTSSIRGGTSAGVVSSAFSKAGGAEKLAAHVLACGVGLAWATAGVVRRAWPIWLGARGTWKSGDVAELLRAEEPYGHSGASQDWIIQHLFALGLRLQAAVAGPEIERIREGVDGVVAGLDQVIVRVRDGDTDAPTGRRGRQRMTTRATQRRKPGGIVFVAERGFNASTVLRKLACRVPHLADIDPVTIQRVRASRLARTATNTHYWTR